MHSHQQITYTEIVTYRIVRLPYCCMASHQGWVPQGLQPC